MAVLFQPFLVGVDGNGLTMPGALLYFYLTGTTTPKDTYTTSGLSTANANPVVADANGLFPPMYLTQVTDYKAILKTSAGTTVATRDPLLTTKPITTRGDIITGGVGGIDQRLAVGTSGQFLSSDGTDVVWSSTITIPDGTVATTQAVFDNSTKIATDAYVDRATAITHTSFTPTDGSGAGLALAAVSAKYFRIGNWMTAYGRYTMPATADATGAAIGSLPVAVPNQTYAIPPSILWVTGGVPGTAAVMVPVPNTSTAKIYDAFVNAGTAITNANLSAAVIRFHISWPVA